MRLWLACVALLVCVPSLFAQGKLERAREEMNEPSKPKKDSSSDSKPGSSSGDSDDDPFGELLAPLAGVILKGLAAPLWLPAVLVRDEKQRPGYFPGHPYAIEDVRFINPYGEPKQPADLGTFDPVRYKPWSVRLAVENGNDFDGLNRTGLRVAADSSFRLGVTTNWDYFRERLKCGCLDESVVGDANLTYRIAQTDWMQMHAGVGARIWADRYGTLGGFNFTYGADFFPVKPLVISTQLDLGNLRDAFVTRARATVGWQVDRLELFGGYDFLRIGSVNFQGPMLGARLWF